MSSVAFVTGDFAKTPDGRLSPNGCAWYRLVLPSRLLAGIGWHTGVGLPAVTPTDGIGLAHEGGMLIGWDTTVIKLLMHRAVPDLIRLMQSRGKRIVADVDDFHAGLHPENIASRVTDPVLSPDANRDHYEAGVRAADTITVSTEFLANHYADHPDVRLVRNRLDVARYEIVDQPEIPVFGWVGGTLWRSGDLEMLRGWLPAFAEDHKIRVHHSGHIPGDGNHFAARAGLREVSTVPMCLIGEYPRMLSGFHVGLVPLAPGGFNEAKSFLKGLEYGAAGMPFIATPTREYRVLHEAGVGRLAATPDEWRDHATELLDPDVRRAEGQRNAALVRELFDITDGTREWVAALT